MTMIAYNGVVLPYGLTTEFRNENLYDDSQTDLMYLKVDLTVNGLLSASYLPWLAPDLVGKTDNPAVILNVIRDRLKRPRRGLRVIQNGVDAVPLNQRGVPGQVDARNGPQPQYCNIVQMTETTWFFAWRVIAHYWVNPNVDPDRNPIHRNEKGGNALLNRWSEAVSIDKRLYSTRTREGKCVIRSDNPDGLLADEVRSQLAVVGVPVGFNRDSSDYTVSEDGLALKYRVVDREVFRNPPEPAHEADGEYLETSVKNGAVYYGEARVMLGGAHGSIRPQEQLLATALQICFLKVDERRQALGGPEAGYIMDSASVKYKFYTNEVEASMRVKYNIGTGRAQGASGFRYMFCDAPLSNAAVRPQYWDRGTASLLLQAAAYYDPNLTDNQLTGGVKSTTPTNLGTPDDDKKYQMNHGRFVGRAGKNPEV